MSKSKVKGKDLGAVFYDRNNGDVIENIAIVVPRRDKLKDWLSIFERGSNILARDREITGEAFRIFHLLIANMDYENRILLTQSEVGKELAIKQQNVNKAFKLLVSKGIIVEDRVYGRTKTYRLSADFGWKGTVASYRSYMADQIAKGTTQHQINRDASKTDESVAA